MLEEYSGPWSHSTVVVEKERAMDGLLRSLIKTVRRRLRADEEVTVEAVTKELGYTRQYISGRFHRITGRLLSHFLKEKRLEKAARLLKGGNLRVSQIARRCGFDSENYFRQQFRQRYGMSPRQFRANGHLRPPIRHVAAVATA
ncbi:MAG TPA: helix-turn-helix transcriptional regulator [Thermoanaerobaculia bacterium]|nr:helix-turn-helix transcriptional regulator [Thermoanaerobaculia bacterium]